MSLQSYAVAIVVFVVFMFFSYVSNLNHALTASRAKERETALKFSNYEALHDSTHEMALENPRVALIVGDSVRAFGRRVVQQVPARNNLDSALDHSSVATYQLGATVRQLDAVIAELEAEKQQSGERPFRLRQEPFTVDAVVSQPPGGDSMSLAIHIALDTIPLGLRVQCSGVKDGILEASIVLKAPPWASVRIGAVEQDPKGWSAQIGTAIVIGR
ncbi:MAG: hypothetical protein JWM95_2352 [Gemmatimonadetes bacterium]|nr:hypothetical protein [Gemmatimonadota bacterium]